MKIRSDIFARLGGCWQKSHRYYSSRFISKKCEEVGESRRNRRAARKKPIWLFMAGLIAISCLAGCEKLTPDLEMEAEFTPTPYPTGITQKEVEGMDQEERFSQTLLRIGDLKISYGEVVLYMQSTKEEVETLYGKEIWDFVLNDEGRTYAQMLKEELLKQITYTKLVCSQADRLGIALTEDERMNVDEYTDNYIANFSRDELEYYGITRDLVWGIYADNLLATKIYESLTLNIDTDVSDEEARHPVLWYVFIAKYALAEDGSHVPLDEEGLFNVRERAERLAGEAKETPDFYGFARENTDDTDEIEIVIGRGEMYEELEKIAFGLQQGETSGLIETEDGYFILHCANYMDEDATDQAKTEIIMERQEHAFSDSYAVWEEETSVWVDTVLWDAIDITGEKCE
ncbi:MAG: peptidylprolyl isomerase [Lachnospiraceae bacterium]|nr:peptidylprolyl isomerase [Lachnospiraceae bacterium]